MDDVEDAEHERDAGAEHGGEEGEHDDGHLGASDGDNLGERMADAEVAVDGDGDHDERREWDVRRDEELVRLAHDVDAHRVVDVLHVHLRGDIIQHVWMTMITIIRMMVKDKYDEMIKQY